MGKLSWTLAFSSAVLLHGSVLYALSVDVQATDGDAKGTGQTGVEVGLGQLGSHANAQERLSALMQPKPIEIKKKVMTTNEIKQKLTLEKPKLTAPTIEKTALKPDSFKIQKADPIKIKKEAEASLSEEEREDAKPNQEASLAPTQASTKSTGRADMNQGGGMKGQAKNFINNMNRWLAKHQRYPVAAKKDKQEGTVRVAFTIDRQGNVLRRSIETSSGYALLDEAALKVFDDATPLPRVPDDFVPQRTQLSLVKPIDFTLITNSSFKD
ncbi:hypothetical protein NBRC116188_26850 [Oceaniserpentilla sp. 4NH20-0058]|uniref:energy transducer TonB n=1 Tax=Oceaniserpentilla sp. 4NH20-0058 TaxID=3127660 RepID=UPI003107BB9C